MNYLSCTLFVQHGLNKTNNVIDANELINLAKSENDSLMLVFSKFADFSGAFQLEFFRILPAVKCIYEAVDYRGEHSVLHLCNLNDLSGIIRHNGYQFIFGHLNAKLHFFRNSPNCDWKVRNKRSDLDRNKRIPTYYSEYIDGIKRWVELIMIADHSIYKKYEEDKKRVNERLHSISSTVNSLYAPLNIRVILTWANIWDEKNALEVTENADGTLRDFLNFRRSLLANGHSHDNAQLLTDVHFGSGTMCSFDYSGGVIVDHSENPVFVGMTVAHEMGHNFGMDHDISPSCKCPVDSCIMAPQSSRFY